VLNHAQGASDVTITIMIKVIKLDEYPFIVFDANLKLKWPWGEPHERRNGTRRLLNGPNSTPERRNGMRRLLNGPNSTVVNDSYPVVLSLPFH
jgi:hypothetical protein